ncbi:MAG: radical SAM protein [Verrucomicrobiae bacterium]|nr:radical SAM protein [Verrucomicrobiae bacterium]
MTANTVIPMPSPIKILLVNPVQYTANRHAPKYQSGSMPPTNVLTVAGILGAFPEVQVRVVDEFLDDVPFDEPFDLVGISTTFTSTFPRAIDIGREFRKRGVPVIMGGTHVTCNPEDSAPHADALVVGEAEHNLPLLIQDFLSTRKLRPVYRQEKHVDFTQIKPTVPAYDLVDLDRYMKIGLFRKTNYFALETGRGCPMNCGFCAVRITHGNRLRFKPISQVIDQIRLVKKQYNGRLFTITDDNFLFDEDRATELLKAMVPEKINFFCETSTHIVERPHLLPLLKQAGCISLFIGFESINQKNMSLLHKNHNQVDRYREIFGLLKKQEIPVVASFMLGLDEDDESVFDQLGDFLDSVCLRRAMIGIVTPMPGTAFHRQIRQEGRILNDDLSLYDGCHVVFRPRQMTPERLHAGWTATQKRHYSWNSICKRLSQTQARDFIYTLIMNAVIRNHVYHGRMPYHSGIKQIR